MKTIYYKKLLLLMSLITILSISLNAKSPHFIKYTECINNSTNGIAMNSQYASYVEDEFLRQEKIQEQIVVIKNLSFEAFN